MVGERPQKTVRRGPYKDSMSLAVLPQSSYIEYLLSCEYFFIKENQITTKDELKHATCEISYFSSA